MFGHYIHLLLKVYLKRKKKSTHPSDQKKVNCWDWLMIRTNTISTLKAWLRRTGTNREGFYSALIFTLRDICAKPSRFSDQRQPVSCRGWVRKEGQAGGWRQWELRGESSSSPSSKCRRNNAEKGGWLRPGQWRRTVPHRCYPPPRPGFSITFTRSQLWTTELYFLVWLGDFKGKHMRR